MGERKGRGRSYRPPQKKRGLANSTTPVKWGDVPASISIPIPAPARETSTGAGDQHRRGRPRPASCLFVWCAKGDLHRAMASPPVDAVTNSLKFWKATSTSCCDFENLASVSNASLSASSGFLPSSTNLGDVGAMALRGRGARRGGGEGRGGGRQR